ncbi:acylphosphatase [Aestuariispira insulae]|uniref:acylphosphatase n=1 Tax=Aestuariispira insulae TaxID=1461337 RepID=A0A3D9HT41_9PROT|nr:acylphosphatase [Aestuariispira insulae]RED52521.1 acylphosphatase [Aestuariispira insulae]
MVKTVSVIIEGKVQGVWYRGWTEATARELGLSGWVRNLSDGSVEALFSGAEAAVEDMLERCWQGPEPAIVTAVNAKSGEAPETDDFVVRSTK